MPVLVQLSLALNNSVITSAVKGCVVYDSRTLKMSMTSLTLENYYRYFLLLVLLHLKTIQLM